LPLGAPPWPCILQHPCGVALVASGAKASIEAFDPNWGKDWRIVNNLGNFILRDASKYVKMVVFIVALAGSLNNLLMQQKGPRSGAFLCSFVILRDLLSSK
jgi:hypothetical protein